MTDTRNVTLHWFLPTTGDSREIVGGGHGAGPETGERYAGLDYLTQVARAAEYNGFESVLTPTGRWCQDAWVTASALAGATSRLKFLVALRPGLVGPTLTAHQALTLQELSGDRLLLNVVVGGEDAEQRAFGDFTTKAERYAIADETLQVAQHLWTSPEPLTFHGKHLRVEDAALRHQPATSPPIFLGGSSDEGIEVAARRADVYLTWGEPPEQVAEKIGRVRARASSHGRTLEYGVRLHVIARPTADEAWAEAQRLLDAIDPEQVRAAQAGLATSQSEGQRRMRELHGAGSAYRHGQDARSLEIGPGLWAGVGLVRGGAGTALVGSYEDVAARIDDYRRIGVNHLILSGVPHLEETFRVGEGVVPALQARGVTVTNAPA
jgi:alkanesulfonate monooxygenase